MQNQSVGFFEAPKYQELSNIFQSIDVAEATRKDYVSRAKTFVMYVQQNGIHRDSFLCFKRELQARTDVSVATKNKYLVSARILLKELNRRGVLPADITQNVKSFSDTRKHKKDGLSDIEIARLSKHLQALPRSPENTRLRAVVALLALQGLRQIEVVRLDVKDLQLARKIAFIHGKGRDGKEPIALQPETVRVLKEYLTVNNLADGALFVSNSNNSLQKRLTTKSLRVIVTRELKKLGIDKSTHAFRHYYTTKLIKSYKGDLLQVAQYTRHRSIDMLQVYFDGIKNEEDLPRYYQTFEEVVL